MKGITFIFCFILTIIYPALAQSISDRYALVIGVKDYEYVQPLRNSLNDAQDMAAVLKSKGFTVIELYNPKTKREMTEAVKAYFNMLVEKKGAAGVLYYSGHSMQVKGVNYFMPTTSNPQLEADLDDQALRMEYLLNAVEQVGNVLNIFILDACRNNPFRGFTRSSDPGLSQVNAPKGSYVVYATAPGSVASDGTGRNGLFTSKLLKYINTPGISIEQVFKNVARDVQRESGGSQIPWINYSYFGDFSFDKQNAASTYTPEKISITNTSSQHGNEGDLFRSGVEDYERKDYNEALHKFRKVSEQGNTDAQFYLAYMYANGLGVPKSNVEAVYWCRNAAEKGHIDAQNELGQMYANGQGITQDYTEAFRWYYKAAEHGNTKAQYNLAFMYSNGHGVNQSYSEALRWYYRAAEHGNTDALYNLGLLCEHGRGVTQNYHEAISWYSKAAAQDHVGAQYNLAEIYAKGHGVPQNYSEAAGWYRRAAEQGYADAQYSLGIMYANGQGVVQDHKEALFWRQKALEQGHVAAQNSWLAANNNRTVTAEEINGYREGAEQGNAFAQYSLGMIYYNGNGVNQDYSEAANWYRKAAEQGYSNAQYSLGLMYTIGRSVTQNYDEAILWIQKAADQDHIRAQHNMGWLYENGRGVLKDIDHAISWYKKAAAQDDKTAIESLKRLKVSGY